MRHRLTKLLQKPALWLGLAVALLTLLPYLGVGGFELVNLDDYLYVACGPVTKGLSLENVRWALGSFTQNAIWMPVTWFSYMLDVSLFGGGPGVHHGVSALLHAANAALVFVLLAAVLRRLEAGGGLGRFTVRPSASHRAGGSAVGEARSGRDGSPLPSAHSDDRDVGREPVACAAGRTAGAAVPTGESGRQGLPSLPCDLRLLTAAALAALFWSLHPLRVESVAWVSSRKDVLSLFWELLALIFWVRGIETGNDSRGGAGARSSTDGGEEPGKGGHAAAFRFASLLCFALAGMSKPTAMTFPVLAGLLDYLLLRKVRWQALYVPAVMALACGMIASYSQMSGGAKAMLGDVPLWGRLLNAVAAIGDYCWKTVWPADLMIPYLHTWPSLPNFFWPGLALCVLYGLVLLWSGCRCGAWQILTDVLPPSIRRGVCAGLNLQPTTYSLQPFLPALFVGLAWFIVAVAPMLGLANFGYHSHADRFTYLPGIGFALIVAVALAARRQARRCFRLAAAAGGAAALLTLGAAAWRQATVWKDDPTLYRHTLAIDPGNYVANRSLGLHYCGHGPDYAKAAAYFDEAFRVNRECNRVVQIGYVVALAGSGALGRAKEEARDLAELHERNVAATLDRGDPLGQDDGSTRSAETFIAYGIIAYYEGDRGLARQHAETVLGRSPDHAYAHYILGLIARDEGRREEAVERWKISAGSDPITLRPFLERWIAELERQETSNHVWQAR